MRCKPPAPSGEDPDSDDGLEHAKEEGEELPEDVAPIDWVSGIDIAIRRIQVGVLRMLVPVAVPALMILMSDIADEQIAHTLGMATSAERLVTRTLPGSLGGLDMSVFETICDVILRVSRVKPEKMSVTDNLEQVVTKGNSSFEAISEIAQRAETALQATTAGLQETRERLAKAEGP